MLTAAVKSLELLPAWAKQRSNYDASHLDDAVVDLAQLVIGLLAQGMRAASDAASAGAVLNLFEVSLLPRLANVLGDRKQHSTALLPAWRQALALFDAALTPSSVLSPERTGDLARYVLCTDFHTLLIRVAAAPRAQEEFEGTALVLAKATARLICNEGRRPLYAELATVDFFSALMQGWRELMQQGLPLGAALPARASPAHWALLFFDFAKLLCAAPQRPAGVSLLLNLLNLVNS